MNVRLSGICEVDEGNFPGFIRLRKLHLNRTKDGGGSEGEREERREGGREEGWRVGGRKDGGWEGGKKGGREG